MDGNRLVTAQFCDDIRHEVGNKYSLMGCYGNEMIVDKIPSVLPKLCAHIRVFTPAGRPFENLVIRAYMNDDLIAEIEMPVTDVSADIYRQGTASGLGRVAFLAMMAFSPLAITEPCKIRIEAETEDGIVRGSYIDIRERIQEDLPVA
ncbi:MAG TPA: hypothetical protein VMV64_11400 [Sulfuricella sp.]|nr:hypothetical protein [Sulfuricella sp.]